MRLSKKQQNILEIVHTQKLIEKQSLFEELEGTIEDRKIYRSRYSSFGQTLKKLIERGQLEWYDDRLTLASISTQEEVKQTEDVLDALTSVRENQLPLTLSNLQQFTNIKEWVWAITKWKLKTLSSEENRIIDLDARLDQTIDSIESILNHLGVDLNKIINSGVIFSSIHFQQFQNITHTILRGKILNFSIPHKTLDTVIRAKRVLQPSSKTINELVEPAIRLADKEIQSIVDSFESSYQKNYVALLVTQMFQTHQPFESQLQLRFPKHFVGVWEWDRLYQQLILKIVEFAKIKGLYQNQEEWKQSIKHHSRKRFQRAQDSSKNENSPKPEKTTTLSTSYQMLGIDERTTVEEIKNAFRKLAKAHHPDSGGNPEYFRSLNKAYTYLLAHYEKR